MVELQKIATEQRNPNTMNIDTLSTLDMVKLINQEDHRVAEAVGLVTDKIAQAVDVIAQHLSSGGRLIYCGAGTSGRLGILDAVECPPTYSTEPEMVQALMAGGYGAIFKAVEGAEDSRELGVEDMKQIHFCQKDVLVGIAASGRTPYVLGCMAYAKELGAPTISVTCCPGSELDQFADIGIAPCPGPEVVTGSTRMKAGTAQKLILNMLSTCAMIQTGRVRENLMINVRPTNIKLVDRAVRIIRQLHPYSQEEAREALERAGNDVARALDLLEG